MGVGLKDVPFSPLLVRALLSLMRSPKGRAHTAPLGAGKSLPKGPLPFSPAFRYIARQRLSERAFRQKSAYCTFRCWKRAPEGALRGNNAKDLLAKPIDDVIYWQSQLTTTRSCGPPLTSLSERLARGLAKRGNYMMPLGAYMSKS